MSKEKHILIVDDDDQVLLVWRGALTKPEWHITTASNGETALAMITENAYDLLVTDIRMPQMSGCELTQAIRGLSRICRSYG